MTPDPQPQQPQKEEEVLIKKYKTYISNIKWHIKTNKPEGSALDYCQIQLKCFEEIRSDLQQLAATQPIQGKDEKEYPIEFIEWYSGESEDTIKSAYNRYQKEIEQGQP